MDRRHFLAAASAVASAQLFGPGSSVSASGAAEARELRGTLRRLTEPGSGDNRATFMPDGKTLLFASAVSARIDEPHSRIYVMGADGSNLQPIHQPDGVDNVHPTWSPDGHRIVFTSGKGADGAIYAFYLA